MVVGAGPAGLFAAFQLGLFGIDCRVIEAGNSVGGQLAALYADKPIFDAPGFNEILAGNLVDRLVDQARLTSPRLELNCRAKVISRSQPTGFVSDLSNGERIASKVVVLATGGGILGAGPSIDGSPVEEPLPVDPGRFETALPGIYAIGDGATYPGKLRLILSAFHEAALMTQAVRGSLAPMSGSGKRRGGSRARSRQ